MKGGVDQAINLDTYGYQNLKTNFLRVWRVNQSGTDQQDIGYFLGWINIMTHLDN